MNKHIMACIKFIEQAFFFKKKGSIFLLPKGIKTNHSLVLSFISF